MAEVPSDKIQQMRTQGYTNSQIIDVLQRDGYSSSDIFDALNKSSVPNAGAPPPPPPPNTSNDLSEIPKDVSAPPSMPTPPAPQQEAAPSMPPPPQSTPQPPSPSAPQPAMPTPPMSTPQPMSAPEPPKPMAQPQHHSHNIPTRTQSKHASASGDVSTEEYVEAIIDEKWAELEDDIHKVVEWKNRSEQRMQQLNQQVADLKDRFDKLHAALIGKIESYDKNILEVGAEIKAMEKVFSKVLPVFTDNVKQLSNITDKMSKK